MGASEPGPCWRQLAGGVMSKKVVLLRAVNVGGTGTLTSKDLARVCEGCGFTDVKTVLQSGNAVFSTSLGESAIKKKLEAALGEHMKSAVGALVRDGEAIADVLAHNPFVSAAASQVIVFFLDAPLAKGTLDAVKGRADEEIVARGREVYVHYPSGQGKSKLKLPFAASATGRNLNTLAKIVALAGS